MICTTHTVCGATLTSDGLIAHHCEGDVHMPVALIISSREQIKELMLPHPPKRDAIGRVLFVSPSGELVLGS